MEADLPSGQTLRAIRGCCTPRAVRKLGSDEKNDDFPVSVYWF